MKRLLNTVTSAGSSTLNHARKGVVQSLTLGAVLLAGAAAQANVVNYGGQLFAGVETSPPGNYNLQLNHTEDNTRAHAYLEQYRILLDRQVTYHAHGQGSYMTPGSLTTATRIPGVNTSIVNSYLIHFDPTSGLGGRTTTGWIEFNAPIYIITHPNNDIDQTDARFGMNGVTYGQGLSDRGWDLASADWFDISTPSAGIWKLSWEANASSGMDEMRIIEIVDTIPTPGSVALLGLGGLAVLRRRRG